MGVGDRRRFWVGALRFAGMPTLFEACFEYITGVISSSSRVSSPSKYSVMTVLRRQRIDYE
jgi:hypothetical protein